MNLNKNSPKVISAGVAAADFMHLSSDLKKIDLPEIALLHFDIMQTDFVTQSVLGLDMVRKIHAPHKIKDVHLMARNPEKMVKQAAACGVDILTAHLEATDDAHLFLSACKEHNIQKGLAVCPLTPISQLKPYMKDLDYCLLLGIDPRLTQPSLDPQFAQRISELDQVIQQENKQCLLGIDGGINIENFFELAAMPINIIVTGSAIFNKEYDGSQIFTEMLNKANSQK